MKNKKPHESTWNSKTWIIADQDLFVPIFTIIRETDKQLQFFSSIIPTFVIIYATFNYQKSGFFFFKSIIFFRSQCEYKLASRSLL